MREDFAAQTQCGLHSGLFCEFVCCSAVQAWQLESVADWPCQDGYMGSSVTCLSFSPILADIFAAGHADGMCAFYSMHKSAPRWTLQV